mmetsp:Transcript_132827/g.384037  ORF Transcript_132827/g.384037 Transcript_132827/m.384037 type:complete len:121 (-) Transcript_132827:329-691(-)
METKRKSWQKFRNGGTSQRNKKRFGRTSIRKTQRKNTKENGMPLLQLVEVVAEALVEDVDERNAVEAEALVEETVDEDLHRRRKERIKFQLEKREKRPKFLLLLKKRRFLRPFLWPAPLP